MPGIMELPRTAKNLSAEQRDLFERILDVSASTGRLVIPESFRAKARGYSGRRDAQGRITETEQEVAARLEAQTVVRVRNRITGEEALFNELRASRPGMRPAELEEQRAAVQEHIEEARQHCDFCEPLKYTSADTFGRIRRPRCVTGANVAKYDACNGMVYFREHDPLAFTEEELADVIDAGFEWFAKVHEQDARFGYPFFMWNCLRRAGASQVHAHTHVLVARDRPYAKTQALIDAARRYRESGGGSAEDYFGDLFRAHELVGLGRRLPGGGREPIRLFANLTPVKEKETILLSDVSPADSPEFKRAIFRALRCLIDKTGMCSFNLAICMAGMQEPGGIPYVVRIVDRGSITGYTADIGGMELYGSPVIATDPYRVFGALAEAFG